MVKLTFIFFSFFQIVILFADIFQQYYIHIVDKKLKLKNYSKALFFLAVVWVLYFVIQNIGAWLLPIQSLKKLIFHWFQLEDIVFDPSISHWNWKLIALLFWSFHAISFWDYVTHRWVLHRKTFWIFHEYHHLSKIIMCGIPGVHSRPYAFFPTILTNLASLFFILIPANYFLLKPELITFIEDGLPSLALILGIILSTTHSSFLRQFKWVHHLCYFLKITSPQEHLLHHSTKLNVNYGNFATYWDRLFCSYQDPMNYDINSEPLGLSYDQDYLGTLFAGKIKLSPRFREKFSLDLTLNIDNSKDPQNRNYV